MRVSNETPKGRERHERRKEIGVKPERVLGVRRTTNDVNIIEFIERHVFEKQNKC